MKASRFDLHVTEMETTCFCEGKLIVVYFLISNYSYKSAGRVTSLRQQHLNIYIGLFKKINPQVQLLIKSLFY